MARKRLYWEPAAPIVLALLAACHPSGVGPQPPSAPAPPVAFVPPRIGVLPAAPAARRLLTHVLPDDFADALDLGDVSNTPFSHTFDTATATIEATDPVRDDVRLPGSVWFKFTGDPSRLIVVDTRGSDYGLIISVHRGAPDATSPTELVGEFGVGTGGGEKPYFNFFPQDTTYLMATAEPGVTPGNLSLTVRPLIPAPTAVVTVERATIDVRTNVVKLRGTVMSDQPGHADLGLRVEQLAGHFLLAGSGQASVALPTPGVPARWEGTVAGSPDGRFAGGRAQVVVSTNTCGIEDCGFTVHPPVAVTLKGSK